MGLLVAGGASLGCGQPGPEGGLFFWRFNEIFVGELREGRVVRRPVGLDRPIENIISASAAGHRLAIVGLQRPSNQLVPFLVELPGGAVTAVVEKEARQVALASDGRWLAFTTNARSSSLGDVADISVHDLVSREDVTNLRGQASSGTIMAWHPDGKILTFDVQRIKSESKDPETEVVTRSYQSWIKSADLDTGRVTQLLEGSAPGWSPDGKRLAYYRDGSLFVYDTVRSESKKLYGRGHRQAVFVGATHWSPAGEYVTVNVGAGAMEERLECLVINVASGAVKSLGVSSYWCGPWLPTSSSARGHPGS
jgi:hypothetical protein